MKKPKTLRRTALGLSALALLLVVLAGVSEVASQTATSARLESRGERTVLYSVHKGSPFSAVETFHKLVALRESEGFEKANESGIFVYLNSPANPADQLIEVQIPVTKSAAARQGTLDDAARQQGLGTTDVKTIPPSTVAAITKPAGVSDPGPYYNRLYNFVSSRGLTSANPPAEQFDEVEAIPAVCTYDELETELSVGVSSVSVSSGSRRAGAAGREGQQ